MPTARLPELGFEETEGLLEELRSVGFPLAGAVDLDLARDEFAPHGARYCEWIAAGFHGEMGYLERGLDRRLDPRIVFPPTESVWAVAIPYRRHPSTETTIGPRYARYLEGPDYHRVLPERMETALASWSGKRFPGGPDAPKWKICVDTSAVLERSWAALCGLGWIGKNSLLIHPQLGSYLFLGVVLLDRKTGRKPAPLKNYCGNCSACLEGCPTSALISPGLLDARKCIAYLTLEKRGPWTPPDPTLPMKMGTWIAGCDICQEVCPYNRKPVRLDETWPTDVRDSALITDWGRLESETETEYQDRISDSALKRIKFPEMARNLAQAKQNSLRAKPTSES